MKTAPCYNTEISGDYRVHIGILLIILVPWAIRYNVLDIFFPDGNNVSGQRCAPRALQTLIIIVCIIIDDEGCRYSSLRDRY